MMIREPFPLVGDDEVLVRELPVMDLYDDWDLISNIQGPYEDKPFSGPSDRVPQNSWDTQPIDSKQLGNSLDTEPYVPRKKSDMTSHSYSQAERAKAREDLKRKRSAPYLNFDKPGFKSKELPNPKPSQKDKDKAQVDRLSQAANRLRQKTYIKADIKPTYQHVPPVSDDQPRKNTYDFLKTSQVYNYQENQIKKEKKTAQELNLTRFEQWKKL
ncbi:cystathionine gamma-synthase [Streptococcus ovuberis]|uniref:Cystathionine gamma-synthase n=1 Tax=Streptococcus ovuberis TaxID=1936207 RepID=A0A7X6S0W9_9STRE|nr:cystathionine gamma-synthase [Streptococcus ovuberis]NKZ19760.1 cystathionine gamma-synthase [Streptococcus ovuberis]